MNPLQKKNDRANMSNYRPVSLLSILGKVMEKIIFKHMYNYLVDDALITQYQSGFLPGVSTVSQLTELYHSFCQALSKKGEVRVVFLDISKAFDRVWHRELIFKLSQTGVSGGLLNWFLNYLHDRQQRVIINRAGYHDKFQNRYTYVQELTVTDKYQYFSLSLLVGSIL